MLIAALFPRLSRKLSAAGRDALRQALRDVSEAREASSPGGARITSAETQEVLKHVLTAFGARLFPAFLGETQSLVEGDVERTDPALEFDYEKNGVIEHRQVEPIRVWYGVTTHHPTPQWFLHAKCLDRGEERDFPLAQIMQMC